MYLLSRLALRMRQLFVGLMLALLLASCSAGDVLSALNPLDNGGINANANIGKDVTQGVRVSVVRPASRVETNEGSVDQSINNIQQTPFWILALLIIGWLAPSPGEIGRGITKLWRNK